MQHFTLKYGLPQPDSQFPFIFIDWQSGRSKWCILSVAVIIETRQHNIILLNFPPCAWFLSKLFVIMCDWKLQSVPKAGTTFQGLCWMQSLSSIHVRATLLTFVKPFNTFSLLFCPAPNTAGIIAGAIIAVLLFLIIIAIILFCCCRARNKKKYEKEICNEIRYVL